MRVRGSRLYLPAKWSWQRALHLPVIVHDRDAHADSMEITRRYPDVIGVYTAMPVTSKWHAKLLKTRLLSVIYRCYHIQKMPKKAKEVIRESARLSD